jgi:hypothetical protein
MPHTFLCVRVGFSLGLATPTAVRQPGCLSYGRPVALRPRLAAGLLFSRRRSVRTLIEVYGLKGTMRISQCAVAHVQWILWGT